MHRGELEIHKLLGVPPEVTASMPWSSPCLDYNQARDIQSLPFFVFGFMDKQNRPFATLVPSGGVSSPCLSVSREHQSVMILHRKHVIASLANTVADKTPFAGLAIDYSQRRRLKIAGGLRIDRETGDFVLTVNEVQGNCPKYINTRQNLTFLDRCSTSSSPMTSAPITLDTKCIELIHSSDTCFVSSCFIGDEGQSMDVNHRGGPIGFVRATPTHLYWPDYSGNRIYSTMGNIHANGVAGIVFFSFATGDILHITGKASVLVDGSRVIKKCTGPAVSVLVTHAHYLSGALNLAASKIISFSPYNPPVKYTVEESLSSSSVKGAVTPTFVKIVNIDQFAPAFATFTVEIPPATSLAPFLPGQYAIFDFSAQKPFKYKHMNDANPQLINDDFIRTWTISSAPSSLPLLSCTIKLKRTGEITPLLFSRASLDITFKGVDGDFSCFSTPTTLKRNHSRMVWVAAGSGITPFLSFITALLDNKLLATTEIVLLYSCRSDDAVVADRHFRPVLPPSSILLIKTDEKPAKRRMSKADIAPFLLPNTQFYLCGPAQFMNDVIAWMKESDVKEEFIHKESFF